VGASGALHTNDRFLFSRLSECVRLSRAERQRRVRVPGGVRVQEPATAELDPVPATPRAWSRKPMKSRELRSVTEDTGRRRYCELPTRYRVSWSFVN